MPSSSGSSGQTLGPLINGKRSLLHELCSGVKVPSWARSSDVCLAWPFPLALLLCWFLISHFEWLPMQILPSPLLVVDTFFDILGTGELQTHTWISFKRVLAGFALGCGLGLMLGVVMGLSETARDYLYPTFKIFAQVPSLGWLPLLMMLVGLEEALKIILISKSAFVPITLNTFNGLRSVPTRYIEVARAFEFSRYQLLTKVVFPSAFPPIWNGVRYGLTHAWLALVGVELLASTEGLGYLIVWGRQLFQLDLVLAAVFVIGFIGLLLDKVLGLVESHILRWRKAAF